MTISELVTTTPDVGAPQVTVNGQPRELGEVGGHVTLLDWLRGSGFTGSKEGCAEGECGACAVLVARPDGDATRWTAINACLVPAAGLDQQEVITAEGIGQPGRLHPVQQEMASPRRVAVWLLHTGFHLLDGLGVLPRATAGPTHRRRRAAEAEPGCASGTAAERSAAGNGSDPDRAGQRPRPRARPERLRPARAVRKPVPLHRLSADPGRGLRAGRARCRRSAADPARPSRHRPPRPPTSPAARAASGGRPTWPRPSTCWPPTPTPGWWPGPPTGASS